MLSKRVLLVVAIVCAFLLAHEGVFAQRSGSKGNKSGNEEKKSDSKAKSSGGSSSSRRASSGGSGSRGGSASSRRASSGGSSSRSSSASSRRTSSNSSASNRTSGGGKTISETVGRITRDRSSSRGSGGRDRGTGSTVRNGRTSNNRDTSTGSVWRDAVHRGDSRRRGIGDRKRIKRDHVDREGRQREDRDGNRGTIIDRTRDRRFPPPHPPAWDCLDYDHCDIIIEQNFWITNYIDIRYYPVYLPIGVLIPETIDPDFIAKVDSLVYNGFGDEMLVCLLQMSEPFEGYELYDVFEGLDDLVVLRKLSGRTFIVRAWAESIYDIMDHPLVIWIDEYRSAYKYRSDNWEQYQYTYIYLMGEGDPHFVRELEKMGIPLVRTPDPYSSCYCVLIGSERVPEIADLWWVYEITPHEL